MPQWPPKRTVKSSVSKGRPSSASADAQPDHGELRSATRPMTPSSTASSPARSGRANTSTSCNSRQCLKIGRTPVHQALDRLMIEGMVEVIPRKGVIVKPVSLNEVLQIIEARLINEAVMARDLRPSERTIPTCRNLADVLKRAKHWDVAAQRREHDAARSRIPSADGQGGQERCLDRPAAKSCTSDRFGSGSFRSMRRRSTRACMISMMRFSPPSTSMTLTSPKLPCVRISSRFAQTSPSFFKQAARCGSIEGE